MTAAKLVLGDVTVTVERTSESTGQAFLNAQIHNRAVAKALGINHEMGAFHVEEEARKIGDRLQMGLAFEHFFRHLAVAVDSRLLRVEDMDAVINDPKEFDALKRRAQDNHNDRYAELREAIRRISVGPDGRAPLAQTHDEAMHVMNMLRKMAAEPKTRRGAQRALGMNETPLPKSRKRGRR